MTLQKYLTAAPGRIAVATLSFAFLAAGLLLLIGPGKHVFYTLTGGVLLVATGFIISVGTAIQDYGKFAVAMVITLPFVAGIYFIGLKVLIGKLGGGWAFLLMTIGYVGAWFAATGYRYLDPTLRKAEPESEGGHDAHGAHH
jgi:hypothetical protein